MSLLQKMYEAILSEFKEEICRNPDADFTPYIQDLAAQIVKRGNEREDQREQSVINSLVLGLYDEDVRSLKRDIIKIMMFGTAKATPSQRADLLRCVCEALSLHSSEDFSEILAMCDRLMEDDSPNT